MCLIISNNTNPGALIATEDIECYKVLFGFGVNFITPYWDAVVELGTTYKSDIHINKCVAPNIWRVEKSIHSFISKDDARQEADQWSMQTYIIRCVIPKGAQYYAGKFGLLSSYASSALKYIEIIK